MVFTIRQEREPRAVSDLMAAEIGISSTGVGKLVGNRIVSSSLDLISVAVDITGSVMVTLTMRGLWYGFDSCIQV